MVDYDNLLTSPASQFRRTCWKVRPARNAKAPPLERKTARLSLSPRVARCIPASDLIYLIEVDSRYRPCLSPRISASDAKEAMVSRRNSRMSSLNIMRQKEDGKRQLVMIVITFRRQHGA